jgi:hypothetical protein
MESSVVVKNNIDFSIHTYQQDFHVAPNPKTNIKLDAPGKQGRYVRIHEVKIAVNKLNSRPRKCLGFKTPYQVFFERTGIEE